MGHRDHARTRMVQFHQAYAYEDFVHRGNLSKILGELMMLVEADKRGSEYELPLAYARPGEPLFSVPPNLFLVGLMNTADRSLAMVDYALRRRFAFHTLTPRYNSPKFREFLEQRGVSNELVSLIVSRMSVLNAEIAADKVRLGPGYQIGHSIFTPSDEGYEFDIKWYRRVVKSEIAPLLEEYWSDNLEKAEAWTAKLLEGPR